MVDRPSPPAQSGNASLPVGISHGGGLSGPICKVGQAYLVPFAIVYGTILTHEKETKKHAPVPSWLLQSVHEQPTLEIQDLPCAYVAAAGERQCWHQRLGFPLKHLNLPAVLSRCSA